MRTRGTIYVLLSAICYGLAPYFSKVAMGEGFTTYSLLFLRTSLCLPVLALLAHMRGESLRLSKERENGPSSLRFLCINAGSSDLFVFINSDGFGNQFSFWLSCVYSHLGVSSIPPETERPSYPMHRSFTPGDLSDAGSLGRPECMGSGDRRHLRSHTCRLYDAGPASCFEADEAPGVKLLHPPVCLYLYCVCSSLFERAGFSTFAGRMGGCHGNYVCCRHPGGDVFADGTALYQCAKSGDSLDSRAGDQHRHRDYCLFGALVATGRHRPGDGIDQRCDTEHS